MTIPIQFIILVTTIFYAQLLFPIITFILDFLLLYENISSIISLDTRTFQTAINEKKLTVQTQFLGNLKLAGSCHSLT